MKVDFSKGISISIAGELGKYNTLPIEALVKIMQNWQNLLQEMTQNEIANEVDLNNFNLELLNNEAVENSEKIIIELVKHTINEEKNTTKKLHTYSQNNISLSYALKTIITAEKTYYLDTPLYCLFEKEEDYFVITNEMLDIIGTGESEESAKESFAVEFDYIFTRYNELPGNQLSERLLKIKTIINLLVKSVA